MKKDLFSKPYDPARVEIRIYRLWGKSGYFNPDKLGIKNKKIGIGRTKTYTVTIPPPNITGSLHMGHGLNYTIQDILIRWRRMQGYKTLMLPGTDHAGIATQNVVEKELKKEGMNRHDLGRKKFEERVWKWKKQYGNIILDQLKKLGVSCDWSRTRFTMDPDYTDSVLWAFIHYFNKGWIYRGERVINWCQRCSTSLSDLELEYKEEKGKLWYIRYPLKGKSKNGPFNSIQGHPERSRTDEKGKKSYITVATTRPETMLGDAAVAVNPKDERYASLVGKTVILPIQNREIPIVRDNLVESEFGTGAVKVTPCHDLADFDIAERHNLPRYQVIGEDGRMTKKAGKICEGMTTLECRKKVADELNARGMLEKVEDYTHRVSKCYRCENTIEPLLSKQWFLKMDELAKTAIRAVRKGEVKFHPARWEKVYFEWLKNTRDWCISRQLWWGHRIPVWWCANSSSAEGGEDELSIRRSSYGAKTDQTYFVSPKPPKSCPICKTCKPRQDEDVLDTWFSSALWPFATLGWPPRSRRNGANLASSGRAPKPKSDLAKFYPTQLLSTDRGIINLWVSRMVFSSYEFLGVRPFQDVYIHATVLTREGKRMSKSLGTGIDPLELIEKYGADATRFGLIWQAMGGQDIRFTEEHFLAGKKFCNKMWNASRFVLGQIEGLPLGALRLPSNSVRANENKKLLKQLDGVISATNKDLEKFKFGQALHRLYDFFWHTYCDQYLEYAKTSRSRETQKLLFYGLLVSLKLLHPFVPFITEEIYQHTPLKNKELLFVENWPGLK